MELYFEILDEVLNGLVERKIISPTVKLLIYMDFAAIVSAKKERQDNREKLTKLTRDALKKIESFKGGERYDF